MEKEAVHRRQSLLVSQESLQPKTLTDPLTGEVIAQESLDLDAEYRLEDAKHIVNSLVAKKKEKTQKQRFHQPLPKTGYANKAPQKIQQYLMREYWWLKAEYIHLKALPMYKIDTVRILEYLWLCVPALFGYDFWAKISYDKQKALCEAFVLKEERDSHLISEDHVYIVLNGKVDVVDMGETESTKYHIGNVFGAISACDYVLKENEVFPETLLKKQVLSIEKASLLALSIDDYRSVVTRLEEQNQDLINK